MIEDGGPHDIRNRARSILADADSLHDVAAVQDVVDAFQKIVRLDLGAMQMKEALHKDRGGENAGRENHPDHRSACIDHFLHVLFLLQSVPGVTHRSVRSLRMRMRASSAAGTCSSIMRS